MGSGESEFEELPKPTAAFARYCWRVFQKALDPLGRPRPYPRGRRMRWRGRWRDRS